MDDHCDLHGISPISPGPVSSTSSISIPELPTSSSLSFTASKFIDLLDSLKIPFLENTGHQVLSSTTTAGEGGFARVTHDKFLGADGTTEMAIAIKEFKSAPNVSSRVERASQMSGNMTTQAFIKVSIMKHPFLQMHPNILQLVGITDNSGFVYSTIPFQYCLVTEYASLGSLESYIARNCKKMSSMFKVDILFDIAAR
jgi:hypothetical protein